MKNVIYKYGDERNSRKIAQAIIKNRQSRQLLWEGGGGGGGGGGPTKISELLVELYRRTGKVGFILATKTFQTIRLFIIKEYENFEVFSIEGIHSRHIKVAELRLYLFIQERTESLRIDLGQTQGDVFVLRVFQYADVIIRLQ